jgi:hypothetical protein
MGFAASDNGPIAAKIEGMIKGTVIPVHEPPQGSHRLRAKTTERIAVRAPFPLFIF